MHHEGHSSGRTCRIRLAGQGEVARLGPDLVAALQAQLTACDAHRSDVVVLSGSDRAFCAGLDLDVVCRLDDQELRRYLAGIDELLTAIGALPYLTIAQLDGPAIGAGADLAMACDLRYAAPRASLRFPGAGFGLVLGTRRAAQLLGPGRTLETVVEGSTITAERALQLGAVNEVLEDGQLAARVDALVTSVQGLPPRTVRRLVSATRDPASTATADSIADDALPERARAFASSSARSHRPRSATHR